MLRAIGASKHNITQVFNAETFIIGLCSGLIGIGVTLLILIPRNMIIHHLTNNPDIVAQLPMMKTAVQDALSRQIQNIGKKLAGVIGSSFTVDGDMLASAFQFNMNEEELQRLMMAMAGQATEVSATANLQTLG